MTNKKELVLIVFLALLLVVPVVFFTKDMSFRLDTDYDSNLPIYYFIVDSIRLDNIFPFRIPYASSLPVIGDPLSAVLNPFFMLPILFFGVDFGIRVVLFSTVVLSGLFMWFFLSSLGLKGNVRLWGSLLYEVSGALSAKFASGHIEKFLSYPFIPLFFLLVLKKEISKKNSIFIALIFTVILFSGDFYTFWFLSLFLVSTRIYNFILEKKKFLDVFIHTILVFLFFSIFSAIKLFPFLFSVFPNYVRFFKIYPFSGSIHTFLSFLPFMVPFQAGFYDRPFFQRTFDFHFNWYEYFAFISPLPFIFLIRLKNILRERIVKLLLFLILICVAYVSMKYPYSPFYWLSKVVYPMQFFRVPQRIFTPLTALLICLFALCAKNWLMGSKRKKTSIIIYAIFTFSIIWTFFISYTTLINSFEPLRIYEKSIIEELRKSDKTDFYAANFICCSQTFLIKNKIYVLNYYYGLKLKDAPNFLSKEENGYNYDMLQKIRPLYVISKKEDDFSKHSYFSFLENAKIRVWKTNNPNVFPKKY